VIGRPLAKAKRIWESVIAAQDNAIDAVEPGAKVGDLYQAALKVLNESEIKSPILNIGHGLGVECNEPPSIYSGGDTELLEGMIINVDIPLLELGWGGVQLEDSVLVTSDGNESLTKTDRTLYLL
jgi:Xaa-Pro aminopeptidase